MQRILTATDGSPNGDHALETAAELAKTFGAELVIVNVEQGFLNEHVQAFKAAESASVEEILYSVSGEILEEAEKKARAAGVKKVRTESGLGDAVAFILECAKKHNADLIVVGKRGRGRIAGLLIGSVSQKLVSLAPCKILVVP